jgi:hypothetical protein
VVEEDATSAVAADVDMAADVDTLADVAAEQCAVVAAVAADMPQ